MELGDQVSLDDKNQMAMFLREEFCGQCLILDYTILRSIPLGNKQTYVDGSRERYLQWDLTSFEYEFAPSAEDFIDPIRLKVVVCPEDSVTIDRVA